MSKYSDTLYDLVDSHIDNSVKDKDKILSGYGNHINSEDKVLYKDEDIKEDSNQVEESESKSILDETEGINDKILYTFFLSRISSYFCSNFR